MLGNFSLVLRWNQRTRRLATLNEKERKKYKIRTQTDISVSYPITKISPIFFCNLYFKIFSYFCRILSGLSKHFSTQKTGPEEKAARAKSVMF